MALPPCPFNWSDARSPVSRMMTSLRRPAQTMEGVTYKLTATTDSPGYSAFFLAKRIDKSPYGNPLPNRTYGKPPLSRSWQERRRQRLPINRTVDEDVHLH